MQSLILAIAGHTLGRSLADRTPSNGLFSDTTRVARGAGVGDRVDCMVEIRLVLEKVKILEERMRYQIDKLVRLADEDPSTSLDANGKSNTSHRSFS